jgi:hypothetical protein
MSRSLALAHLLAAAVAGAAGCRPPATLPHHPAPAAAANELDSPPEGLPPLTSRETELRFELAGTVRHFSEEIGERNGSQPWELADAADYLVRELEIAGYSVQRQGHPLNDDVVAQNLIAEVRGGRQGREIVVVGAHYDSPPDSPGASDATGIAAWLALARSLRDFDSLRTLRFVAFGVGFAPPAQTAEMGSMRYAKQAADAKEEIVAMVGLESLGYYSQKMGSQRAPAGLEGTYPDAGDFVSFVGDVRASELMDGMMRVFADDASISAREAVLLEPTDGLGAGDSWAFAQLGFPAIAVTDTGALRNPHHGTPKDTPATLDFERAARVVAGLEIAIRKLAGRDQPLPKPEDLQEEEPTKSTAGGG